jgi:predicted phosphodiesterase
MSKDKNAKLWFVFPDIHFPDHDEAALECALKAHEKLKPHRTLFLGDVLDCGIFSSHPKRKIAENQAVSFKQSEVDPCNRMMDRVQRNTKEWTYYLGGNHEERTEVWAARSGLVAESLYEMVSPENVIAAHRKNFSFIPYSPHTGDRMGFVQIVKPSAQMKSGGLVAVHGWSFSKHAAYVHLEKSRSQSIVFGHTHRAQTIVDRDPWTGSPIKSFNPGTLSKLQPIYMTGGSPSAWSHGFAIIYVGQRSWTEYCINVNNGYAVLPDGTEVKV